MKDVLLQLLLLGWSVALGALLATLWAERASAVSKKSSSE